MFALLLCVANEPACVALNGAWFPPQAADVIVVVDTANRLRKWPHPVYRLTGRIEIQLPPLMRGGFED